MYCPNLLSVAEAQAMFQSADLDKNNLLDYQELQRFNAHVFKYFTRAGTGTEATNLEATEDETVDMISLGMPKKAFFISNNLTYLDLSFQAFRKLPGTVKHLRNLKVLKLKYCVYMQALSPQLGLLNLSELDLTGCISLKTPPLEITRRGVNSVLAYLKRLLTGSVKCKRTQLMFQGLGGVGKTSLMMAMLNKIYQNGPQTNKPNITDGITICDWRVDLGKRKDGSGEKNDELWFSVFDFAGQVVYYNTHQFFLTNRSIYLLVWNMRLGAQHSGLDFWLNSIQCHAPSCPIFIIGTHIDEVMKYEIAADKLKSDYPQIAGFYFVSSYDGTGVDDLTKAIIDIALKEKYMV